MPADRDHDRRPMRPDAAWRGAAVWVGAWVAMVLLDGHVDLGNLALLLVLAAALAALWLPAVVSMIGCAAAVLAFNFAFVPPRGTFSVDVEQHALLLLTMLAVSWLVSLMVSRQRRLASTERTHRLRADQLRALGDTLRDTDDPREAALRLRAALEDLAGGTVALLVLDEPPTDTTSPAAVPLLGEVSDDERVALWLCLREHAMTGGAPSRNDALAWYLPMRGRGAHRGAALLRLPAMPEDAEDLRTHAQALCDQMGLALERWAAVRAAAAARDAARAEALRTAVLASISHDHRTPLATILGAGSSLLTQSDRLTPDQRRRLAATIVDEATQLARLTDNTLQLARLDAPGVALHFDWESAEELVGTALRRVRQRDPGRQVTAQIEKDLPLLRCDAVLLVQLLDNLLDNAFKYGAGQPVEVQARRRDGKVTIAVLDRGPGVRREWQARIFEAFQRGPLGAEPAEAARRGAGVGLAVCRAIARAHGGELTVHEREGGGSRFELALPVVAPPARGAEAEEQAA